MERGEKQWISGRVKGDCSRLTKKEKYDIKIPKNGKNLFTIWKRCVNMYLVEVGA